MKKKMPGIWTQTFMIYSKSIYTEPAPQLHSLVSLKSQAATGSEKASVKFLWAQMETQKTHTQLA